MRHRTTTVIALAAVLLAPLANGALVGTPMTPAQIVRAWSKALNASNDAAAGSLFARGALAIQPGLVVRLNTAKSAAVWNSRLPCSGTLVRMEVRHNVVKATFVLGHRKGHICDGPGQLAAAKFTIIKGKITRWEQVAPDPGPLA